MKTIKDALRPLYHLIRYKQYIKDDQKCIKILFKKKFHYDLPLCQPVSFVEKMQWLKLNDRKSVYTIMADKVLVKEYVAKIIGEEHIIPTINVWDSPQKIDFDLLPNQFVLKCNHNSGEGLFICKSKEDLDKKRVIKKLKCALRHNFYLNFREWPYKDIEPKVFAEELLVDSNVPSNQNDGLIDYKFYCFNGEPKFLYIGFANILDGIKNDYLTFLNLDFTPTSFGRKDHLQVPFEILKPKNFEEMISIARKLANGTKFVRVDLYNIDGHIYFSEFTFFPGGGFARFEPIEADKEIGEMIRL